MTTTTKPTPDVPLPPLRARQIAATLLEAADEIDRWAVR